MCVCVSRDVEIKMTTGQTRTYRQQQQQQFILSDRQFPTKKLAKESIDSMLWNMGGAVVNIQLHKCPVL